MNTVESKPHRIGKRRTENVVFADGHQLTETIARVAKLRKIRSDRAARGGFLAEVFLDDVVTMDAVILCQFDVNVGGALVERNIGDRAAGETRKVCGVG